MRYFNGILLLLLFSGLVITASTSSGSVRVTLLQPTQIALDGATGKILFTGRNNGQTNIYLINIPSGEVRALTNMRDAGSPSLSPDSKHVAFTAIDHNGWNVYVVDLDLDSSHPHALTTESGIFPTWSPDGNSIAFISTQDGRPHLYVMDADGSNQRRLANIDILLAALQRPVWSPDSQRIAIVSTLRDVYVVDLDSSQALLISRAASYGPAWSPDGTKIIFSESSQGTQLQIHMTNPDGTEPQDLSLGYVDDISNPTWSPDGQYIAFTSSGWQKASVYVMDADRSNKRLLVNAESSPGPPRWSPDGRHIAFPIICNEREQIYIAHLDGSAGACLTTGGVRVVGELVWMP